MNSPVKFCLQASLQIHNVESELSFTLQWSLLLTFMGVSDS